MAAGKEFEGKDLDEALEAASRDTGTRPGEIQYELLTEGRRGVFGIGARNVRIWVSVSSEGDTPPRALERSFQQAAPEPDLEAEALLRRLIQAMGFELTLRTTAEGGGTTIELGGADAHHLATNDGELLDALRFLINRMIRQAAPDAARVQLECAGYRRQRDREVIDRARAVAAEVARTGIERSLPPMNAYERRLVHLTVRESPGLASSSEGSGLLKRVKICLAEPRGEA